MTQLEFERPDYRQQTPKRSSVLTLTSSQDLSRRLRWSTEQLKAEKEKALEDAKTK